jgi:transcriptional regulator with XRE-family HTH domain
MTSVVKLVRAHPRRAPDPIDRHVGLRVKSRRRYIGMSQSELAKRIGLTFQQVQKYETGANRISASKLYEISCALAVRVAYFFDELEGQTPSGENPQLYVSDSMTRGASAEVMTFLEIWPTMAPMARKAFMDLLQAFRKQDEAPKPNATLSHGEFSVLQMRSASAKI